ncbi:MAG: hypothetical protein V3T64_07405, partial [Myxococcota bacterium]
CSDSIVDWRQGAMVGVGDRATVCCMSIRSIPTLFPRRSRLARGLITTVFGLSLALAAACDRNIEPFQPGEESRPPDLARIFPGPPPGEAEAGAANSPTGDSGTGPVARQALPPSRAEAGRSDAAAGAAPIEGQIEIAPNLVSARPAGGVLFVIARPEGTLGGPPLAVLRFDQPSFPVPFRIGPDDVMIPSMQFAGSISLTARLDADGNAMTRGASDLSGAVAEALTPGATGVRLVLSERG